MKGAKIDPKRGMGGRVLQTVGDHQGGIWYLLWEAPVESNLHQKTLKRMWRISEGMSEYGEVSRGETVPPQEMQNPSLRGLCKRRENIGSGTIGELPESVRGLTRA